jgi:para-nitrobenzyl esterase
MQVDGGWNHDAASNASEDCLYLNVYTPSLSHSARLPVMVWIHGGAFSGGSGSQEIYEAGPIVSRNVILVTINYRLNVFGFLSHPNMKDGMRANFGLADQIAALNWVKTNIAAFGGDPRNVTLFGQSAGGMSVIALMTSPAARPLFEKAIVESGALLKIPTPSLSSMQRLGKRFAGGASLSEMRTWPAPKLLEHYQSMMATDRSLLIAFSPVVDGQLLPVSPAKVFARHREAKIPLLIGNNSREALAQIEGLSVVNELAQLYGPNAAGAASLYPDRPVDPILGTPANALLTDVGFRCSSIITAARHSDAGAPTWTYQFEQSLPGLESQGAQHSFEIPYVFGSLPAPGKILGGAYTAADRGLSNQIIDYWTRFARAGDPNGGESTLWPKFDRKDAAYIRFASRYALGSEVSRALQRRQCAIFEKSLAA